MLFQKNQIIKNITFLVSLSSVFFIKIIESQYNIPDAGVTYTREFPPDPFYPNGMGKMLKTPVDSLSSINAPMIKCTDPLSAGTYPLPRCISDEFAYNLNSGPYPNVERQSILRSKRRTNHMATWFGQFISFDITSSSSTIPSTPIYIPADDAAFNPPGSIPGELPAKGITSLPFNLTETLPGTSDPLNSARNGISYVTPFLDLNMIYGSSDDQLAILRNGTSCKLLTSNDGRFPPKNAEGKYIKGAGTSARSWSLFTLALSTLWIREHNRLCDELFKEHGNSWTDQKYFEEAQRWNVAFFQKATSEEYLGTILGRPLPTYEGYKPELVPGIDTFFATVAFRYGHTELSDIYRIQDEYGDTIVDLTLDQISEESYIETIPYERVLSSMALQRQEEVDPFFSDAPRNVISNSIVYDLYAFDVSRSRDRGIALYNVVREAYGLPRKKTWDEVTSDKYLQDRLQLLYPGGPDSTEAFVGAFCEDHLDGSNFGELLNASIVTQFNRIRETDRFWWESPERFSDVERTTLRNTTLRDIIIRNLIIDGIDGSQFVRNLWTVQPYPELEGENVEKNISPWSLYSIQYSLDNTHIHFQVELKTSGGEGWFGMGFDPSDNGMTNAEFIVGIVKNRDVDLSNYNSNSGYHPPLKQTSEGLEIKSKNIDPNGVAKIEFSRLLRPPNRKPIRNEQMKYIMAYNPTSSGFSYHGNNRIMIFINFFTQEVGAASITDLQRETRLFHGIGMFLTWCLLFPISIFVVRFRKHTNNYLKIHRAIQLIGGISVSSFGAAAIATMTNTKSSHAWTGLVIYIIVFFEMGLGLVSIWGQAVIISVNHGYPRFAKRTHKVFGITLLLSAWVNIYLGIDTFTLSFGYKPLFWKVFYAVWTLILIVIFIIGEYWWRKGSYSKINHIEEAELDKRKSMRYNNKDHDDLPEFTWEDINERVQRGAFLVVCDGLVVDVRKWIGVHPGGAKILEKVVGTDITNDFYNTHKEMIINEDVETPETRLLLADKSNDYNISNLEKHDDTTEGKQNFGRLIKNYNVARIIDKINTKYCSNSPLATHGHSTFAIKKMLDMVIGKINEKSFIEPLSLPSSPTFMSYSTKLGEGTRYEDNIMTRRIKFRRYKLTSRSTVNDNKKYPVIKFTFTNVYQDEKDVWDEAFLPGHYIEVKSRIEEQVVVRRYTPIEGRLSKSFSIYVKIYPNGLMSTHLNEQMKGSEIQVRGPFDISDRIKLASIVPVQGETLSRFVPPSPKKLEKSSLINPNRSDGCWDELFMICGGTGITPMLQLIKYHLVHIKKGESVGQKDRSIHMYLLYGNRGIEDVIDGDGLKEYETSSSGMLKISYVFSEIPPKEWLDLRSYLEGRITPNIIQEWFNDIKATTLTPEIEYSPAFQPYPLNPTFASDISSSPTSSNFSKYLDIIPANKNFKIVVCGPVDMMMSVDQKLVEMGYSENDYILLV